MRRTLTGMGRVPPSALDLPLLQGAQQLGLQVERHLAHLVEKERALVRQLEAADLARDGAGERALLVAEELAFEQAGGNGGAIQLDEGALAARAQAVDGARQQFLAGSRLALDQHGGIGGRDGLNLAQHVAQAGAFAHDVVEAVLEIDLFFEILLLLGQAVAQLGNLLKGQRVVDGHGHLARHLGQHFRVVLREMHSPCGWPPSWRRAFARDAPAEPRRPTACPCQSGA